MKPKKNPKVDLEKKRGFFLQIGLALSLLIVLGAFEYKTHEMLLPSFGDLVLEPEYEEDIENTFREKKPPPPPPPPAPIIHIVPNNKKVKETEIKGTETDEKITMIPEPELTTDEPFVSVEEIPRFEGCDGDEKCTHSKVMQYISKNIKYPPISRENNITGKVYVSFVVDKSGKVTNVKVLRGVDKYLDSEAIRVVSNMPKFKPGKQRGKAVNVQYTIPIRFSLN